MLHVTVIRGRTGPNRVATTYEWHIGEAFPYLVMDMDLPDVFVVMSADGDELEYLQAVFKINAFYRTVQIAGDAALNIFVNMQDNDAAHLDKFRTG